MESSMATENTPTPQAETAAPADAVAAATAPVASALAQPAPEPQTPTIAGGKNVVLPSASFAKLKQEQRERGKREAITELESKFKAAGFGSLDEAIAAMAEARKAPAPKAAPVAKAEPVESVEETTPVAKTGNANADRQLARLAREREQFAKRFSQEQAQRRKLQRTLEAKEAEFALRETAVSNGVKDVDYALRLLTRELEGKDEAALAAFDEGKFFSNLRAERPYLFGETVVNANTGTGVGGAPVAPKAGTVQQAQGAAGKVDARSMKGEDFAALLRSRGFNATI
jgi:hypothetical protein